MARSVPAKEAVQIAERSARIAAKLTERAEKLRARVLALRQIRSAV